MSIERFNGGMTVRPMSGLPRFKRTACVQLRDGAIHATNRWGKTRSFPLSGAENSPKRAGGLLIGTWWLEDENARLLAIVDTEHFWDTELGELERTAGFPMSVDSDHMLPIRPDVFKVRDLPVVTFGIYSAAIGSVAVALYWLGVLPEWIFLVIALPSLLAAFLSIGVNKLASAKGKDKERQDYLVTHRKEIFASAERELDELEQSLPGWAKEGKPEPGATDAGTSPEQVDGA